MITQRSTYQAENWTSNTKKPHLVIPQSYFRYEPISLSYDPNEFAHFYNKKSHQNFANFDRPEKGRINEFFNSFFEIGYSSTRSCQQQRQKTKKNQRKFVKKRSSQKLENQRSWNFAGFISQQNASKKRLGSCSTPGSATWALAVIFAQNCVFWTFKKFKKYL